ncbi:hypothetical protein [Craterilacuibacter sp.]|uniref:hypothetical protein n=1 Tax=Craterilacuibacter sp. TaxID=2870909 RepID=UPI003F30A8C4
MKSLPSLLLAATLAITGSQVFADDSSSTHSTQNRAQRDHGGNGADRFYERRDKTSLYQAPALSDAERAAQDDATGKAIQANPQDYQGN